MIASDLVTSSLLLLGVIGAGETPSTDEAATGLTALQQLLDFWSGDELMVHATIAQTVALTTGTVSYANSTWTPTTRPVKILAADVLVGGMTFPVELVGPDGWASFDDRSMTAARPRIAYCDYSFAATSISVAPKPAGSAMLTLYSTVDLAALASGAATFSMPESYARAVRFNLAVDLAGEYGRPVDPVLLARAAEAKAQIKTLNASNRAGKSELVIPPLPQAA